MLFSESDIDLKTADEVRRDVLAGERILLVDDNATNRLLITTLLQHWGCRFEAVADGEAALALLYGTLGTGDPFRLVLLDQEMPQMNGIEFLTQVKKIAPYTCMIMLTGYADKENTIKAINEIGIHRYIEKPWNNTDLILAVRNGFERTELINKLTLEQEMNKLRDDFIATLTHDLRTPLLAAIQTLKFFLDGTLGDLNEKQNKFLDTMLTSNKDMLGLVNALL